MGEGGNYLYNTIWSEHEQKRTADERGLPDLIIRQSLKHSASVAGVCSKWTTSKSPTGCLLVPVSFSFCFQVTKFQQHLWFSLCPTTMQDLNHLDKTSLEILAFLCNYLKGCFLLTHLSPVIGNRLLICVHAFDPSMILTLSLGVDSPNLCACFWPILTQSLGMDSPNLCACFWPILTQSLGMDSPNLCACFWPILTQSLEFNSTTLRAKLQHNPSSKLLLSLLFGVALYASLAIQLLDRQAPA